MNLDNDYTYIYDRYLDDIEAYFAGTLSQERLTAMLVAMANDGMAFDLKGALGAEFKQRLEDGRIQGVIQNAWDEMNDCVIESCYEKVYFDRDTAEMIKRSQERLSHGFVQEFKGLCIEQGSASINYTEVARMAAANETLSFRRAA